MSAARNNKKLKWKEKKNILPNRKVLNASFICKIPMKLIITEIEKTFENKKQSA